MKIEQSSIAWVFERNGFYRKQYLLAFFAFVLVLVVIGVLSTVLYYVVRNTTKPLFFATDSMGRLIQVVPVTQPNMTIDEVVAWTIEAVDASLSYDYVNYRSQLQDSQKYYTAYGWTKYMSALESTNNLTGITQRRMISTAEVVGQPVLVTEGILAGAYAWKFDLPVLVSYWLPPYDDNSRYANALTVSVIVQRQPALQSYKGLGIVQLIAKMPTMPTGPTPQISSAPTT